MSTGGREVPGGLEELRRRLERWRRGRTPGMRIPDRLWASAVALAGRYGIHRTCKALRLDYYALKKRVEQQPTAPGLGEGTSARQQRASVPAFVELPRGRVEPESAGRWECTVELEDAHGAKMRVHLRGAAAPDLAALSRSFWNPGP